MSFGPAPPRSETIPADRYRGQQDTPDGSQSRPWTALEAMDREEAILAVWADAVDAEREVAIEAAQAEHAYRKAKALAYAAVVGKNAQEREAKAYLLMNAEADDDEAMHPRQARDYWQAILRSHRERIQWLAQEARYAHSLVVDAREAGR
jgi:hypothetical protein